MIQCKEELSFNGGVQRLFEFDNGYGASVIRHKRFVWFCTG